MMTRETKITKNNEINLYEIKSANPWAQQATMPEARVARQVLSYEQEGVFYGQEAAPLRQKTGFVGMLLAASFRTNQNQMNICVQTVAPTRERIPVVGNASGFVFSIVKSNQPELLWESRGIQA